jgi:predicted RecA/RadA family phage recombinase
MGDTMKNFVQPGDVITLIAPANVKSGEVVSVGAFVGIAAYDAAKDSEIEVALTGVYELPKAAAAVTQGDLAYWDGSKVVADGEVLLGAAIAPAGPDAATCRVRLNGVTRWIDDAAE